MSAHVPLSPPRPEPPPPRPARWLASCLGFCLLLATCVGGPLLLSSLFIAAGFNLDADELIAEKHHSLNRDGDDKIAIITVDGAILEGDGFVKSQIDAAAKDKQVKAVVLRVDSPGGSVTASDFIYHHLVRLRKGEIDGSPLPLVVSMGGMCASGGYYVAMAAGDQENVLFAEPTTWTGSIGVIIPHFNVVGLMEEWKIEQDSVASHPLKGMGSIARKMTEPERAIFQALVDDSFTRFKDIVKAGRKRFRDHPEELDKLATGQVFTSNQAIDNGLVDKEGFIEAAIDRAIELAGLDKRNCKAVKYQKPFGLNNLLAAQSAAAQAPLDLRHIVDLATPRAYYLCTLLPGAL